MKFFFFTILLFTIGCEKTERQTTIKGNIPNLPDGTVYLFKDYADNKVDSTKSKNGIFTITHTWDNDEPNYIGINHMDDKGVYRLFSFTTNAKYKGVAGWGTNVFMSDSNIAINGNLKYDVFMGKLPSNIKPVSAPPIVAGQQNEAFYNTDGDLFENITAKTNQIVKEKVAKYPYSYHLLYKINEHKNSFSAKQIQEFLQSFKGEITQSETYKKLYTYNEKRFNESKISLPLLEDSKAIKTEIIDKKYKKHLIVFWASWCGPCRQEIPLLKKTYSIYNKDIEFISISIDQDKKDWQKSLKQENMNWKQLIAKDRNSDYEKLQILFKLNGAIPYTVLIDNNLKILASSTGLSSEEDLLKILNKK